MIQKPIALENNGYFHNFRGLVRINTGFRHPSYKRFIPLNSAPCDPRLFRPLSPSFAPNQPKVGERMGERIFSLNIPYRVMDLCREGHL
jgi:hypothetical protein